MTSRIAPLLRSIGLLALVVIALPWALIAGARARFGGASPLHGVPSPTDWDLSRIVSVLTSRLTEATLTDIVIRAALVVAWVAILVVVVTAVAELVHMIRYDGIPLPAIRALGPSQQLARLIATGFMVIVPALGVSASAAGADALIAERTPIEVDYEATTSAPVWNTQLDRSPASVTVRSSSTDQTESESTYVVRSGDSIYGIAQRLVGPDAKAIDRFASAIIEANLGREMGDGQRFVNAAFIDVGWVLQLPPLPSLAEAPTAAPVGPVHVVTEGESLWSIAADRLGAGERWREIFDLNQSRQFDDGRQLDDPDLIHPGWELYLPGTVEDSPSVVPPRLESRVSTADEVVTSDDAAVSAVESGVDDVVPVTSEVEDVSLVADDDPAPDNVWLDDADLAASTNDDVQPNLVAAPVNRSNSETPAPTTTEISANQSDQESSEIRVVTLGRATMMSAGILALLGVRRRERLRRSRSRSRLPAVPPQAAAVERVLRSIDVGDRWARVEISVRSVALPVADAGGRVLAVIVDQTGEVEIHFSTPVELDSPWEGAADHWRVPAHIPIELLAPSARRSGAPCPTLVQLGVDPHGREVYVDLEALEALHIDADPKVADSIVSAVATTLAGSILAEVTTLVGVGIPSAAFLGHRRYLAAADPASAIDAAIDAVGSTRTQDRSPFDLRARVTSGETWEPAVVMVGSTAPSVVPPADRTALAIVSAVPIDGPAHRLSAQGSTWTLEPAGLTLTPLGLEPDEAESIARLVDVPPTDESTDDWTLPPSVWHERRDAELGDTIDDRHSDDHDWELVACLLGPVEVTTRDGQPVEFARSKSRELVAWLATHRDRSTRMAARTALWDLDVRDATFANVVSDARRALARAQEPPEGDEWIARTLTDELPLHHKVVTDVDLIDRALIEARLQPPDQAIATLAPVVSRITGFPFEGTSYLWPDAEGLTSQLALVATTATSELAAHYLSVGDIAGVFDATARGLQVVSGHEELIGLRMQAHAQAGDLAGVRHEWDQYERALTRDPWSDGEPSRKLVELRQHLLRR